MCITGEAGGFRDHFGAEKKKKKKTGSTVATCQRHNVWSIEEKVNLSRPDSRSDPIGKSELVSGCEAIYLGLFTCFFFFFFRAELIRVGIQKFFVITKNHLHIQRNYHRSGVHQNLYTYTKSHLLIQTLIHIYV